MNKIKLALGLLSLVGMGAWAQEAAPAPVDPAPVQAVAAETAPAAPAAAPAAAQPAPAAAVVEQAATAEAKAAPVPAVEVNKQPMISVWEAIVFCVVVIGVIFLGIWKSRDEKGSEDTEKGASDYFLAGRGLSWWLVGFSLIAANISTEQFVGMSGKAADWLGMAIASYEWLAAITLVVVAFFFLPKLLRGGVYTIPEFLEYRYNTGARAIMALATLVILVGVPTAGVIYSGAKVISVFFFGPDMGSFELGLAGIAFPWPILIGCIIIALCGTVYVFVGGLKACAWTDLIWGAGLIVGGGVVAYLAMQALGSADPAHLIHSASANSGATVDSLKDADAWSRLMQLNAGDVVDGVNSAGGKLHMARPENDPDIPWTALCIGLWIPNFFYWGLNQYIMQRTLASKSLAEGQLGIVFAAFLKLIIPFVVVIPGILAYNLYRDDLRAEAVVKNAVEMKKLENSEKKAVTVIHVTDSYLMENSTEGCAFVKKNAELMKASPDVVKELDTAISALQADVADESTTMAQRSQLIKPIVKINEEFVKKAKKDDKTYAVTDKLVGFDYDASFPTLLKKLLPGTGWTWFVLAALFGAVVSSLASMLNSASTILTMDIYNKLRKDASSRSLVRFGKFGVLICALIAFMIAPFLGSPSFNGIFNYIQEFQGYLSPGALCVFLFGFFVPKCPRCFGWMGIVINAVLYGSLALAYPDMAFLNRMAVCFGVIVVVGLIFTIVNAARGGEAIVLPAKNEVSLESSSKAKVFGVFVIICTLLLYWKFW